MKSIKRQKVKFNNLFLQNKKIKKNFFKELKKIFLSSNFIGGHYVNKFEFFFKKKIKSKYSISCNSCTDALLIALKALNLKPFDEVITSAHSWIATSATIKLAGAKVVFCDVEKNSFNICLKDIIKKTTKNTKAIVVPHLFGNPANIIKIAEYAKSKNIFLIEDCAQSTFSKISNKYLGTYGDISAFSFYPTKILGSFGDAGMIITSKKKLYKQCYLLSKNGGYKKNQHLIEGFNSRMDNIQALVLLNKIKFINKEIKLRRKVASYYAKNLKKIKEIKVEDPKIFKNHVYHQFVIKVQKKRNKLKKYLANNNIETLLHYPVMLPFLPAYKKKDHKHSDFPNASKNQEQILSLPMNPYLSKKVVDYVCLNIKKFFKYE